MSYSFILVTGGARSGKSSFAEELSLEINRKYWSSSKISYIATGEVMDEEFKDRIDKHRIRRGDDFVTVEEPLDVVNAIKASSAESRVIMVECLATWMGNVFHYREARIENDVRLFLGELGKLTVFKREGNRGAGFIEKRPLISDVIYTGREKDTVVVFVTNEVGSGIVPATKDVRLYRDMLGILNAGVGSLSEHVFSCVAGIPSKIG